MPKIDIIISIIGLGATVTSVWFGIWKYAKESRQFVRIKSAKDRRFIFIDWIGHYYQTNIVEGTPLGGYISVNFKQRGKRVIGEMKLISKNNRVYDIIFEGGFVTTSLLRLEFHNKDSNILQFGTFIFELDPFTEKMEGKAVAFGPISNNVIFVTASLSRRVN